MKTTTTVVIRKALTSLLTTVFIMASGFAMTAAANNPPAVFLPGYAPADQEGNFLTFPDSKVLQNPTTAKAYYDAIDPLGEKLTFTQWLVKTGFIGQESDWHPEGAQDIRTGQPAGVYGPNIINTDSHVIIINNADLGFARNQFIRCLPSCTAKNPIIYSYLENYGYPALNSEPFGFPTPAEAKAAILDAINNRTGRIADVAFEWAPPPGFPSSNTRYGQLYAYIFHKDSVTGAITETRNWPNDQAFLDSQFNSRDNDHFPPVLFNPRPPSSYRVLAGDPFAPELDALGVKQHPGVCFMCHGGKPRNLTITGKYPSQGRSSGFKFLPLDIDNLLFTSDHDAGDPFSRAAQESEIKKYNQAVLITQGSRLSFGVWSRPTFRDEQGVTRTKHAIEVIQGWYGGPTMPSPTQNTAFIPVGWLEAAHGGTAPAGSEDLYLKAVAPSCRACHSQQESDLDFGTVGSFDAKKSDILELTLQPGCESNRPPRGKVVMPAAKRTFDRFWLEGQDQYLATHFGFASTASYCAGVH